MESDFLEFRCVGIEDGGKIPIENTGRGQDISPEFVIENLSPKAKTLAVTLEDLSHPIKTSHTGLFGIFRLRTKLKKELRQEKRLWYWEMPDRVLAMVFIGMQDRNRPKGKSIFIVSAFMLWIVGLI